MVLAEYLDLVKLSLSEIMNNSVKYKFLSYVENWKKLKETEIFKAMDSHCAHKWGKIDPNDTCHCWKANEE